MFCSYRPPKGRVIAWLRQMVMSEDFPQVRWGLLVRLIESTFSEKQIEIFGWKSLEFLHHSEKSQPLAIWFRCRQPITTFTTTSTTKTYTAFSGEHDEGADTRHSRSPVHVFFVFEQHPKYVTWYTAACIAAVVDSASSLLKQNTQKRMLNTFCVCTMLIKVLPLRHYRTCTLESAIRYDATNMIVFVIPMIWPENGCDSSHCELAMASGY